MRSLEHRRRVLPRRVLSLIALVSVLCLSAVALFGLPAPAQVTETTTTTEPAPETTPTTEPAPDTTTTTEPATTTTTEPDATTTTIPTDPEADAGTLDPDEALVPQPEFAALTGHQRAMVQALQTATDTYALRRVALVDLAHQVATAKDALKGARAREKSAIMREIFSRRLEADRKNAQLARVQAQADVSDSRARLAAQTQAVADASAARVAAESAIEHELGSNAVRARPDGITATLVAAQAGQPDPIVIGGIAQPIPGAALSSPFGLRNDPLSGGAGFHPGVDLTATPGRTIQAAAAGVVVVAGDCGGYGNCVVIDHGVSLATLYGHQSTVLVQVGAHVDAGQVIGRVGSTGMSTGPHLHFEVRQHGLPIDPLLALLPI